MASPSGAGDWNRTSDLRFTKPLLYQLSYAGLCEGRSPTLSRVFPMPQGESGAEGLFQLRDWLETDGCPLARSRHTERVLFVAELFAGHFRDLSSSINAQLTGENGSVPVHVSSAAQSLEQLVGEQSVLPKQVDPTTVVHACIHVAGRGLVDPAHWSRCC